MSGDHRDLHVLTHSFPTRRSSDLRHRDASPIRPSIPHTPASCCSPSLMHMPTKATGRLLIFSLLTALFAGLLFTPGLPGEFVFDDIPNIVNNEAIQITELDTSALAKVAEPHSSPARCGHCLP